MQIRAAGRPAVVSSPNTAMFYHDGQCYERGLVTPAGDACEWIVLRRDILLEMIAEHDPGSAERPLCPFPAGSAPSDSAAYLLQRRVVHALHNARQRGQPVDTLAAEELLIEAVRRQIAALYRATATRRPNTTRATTTTEASSRGPTARGTSPALVARAPRRRASSQERERQLVDAAGRFLALRYRTPLRLGQIAAACGGSVFHLCRVFRRHSGMPLHRFLRRLRVRAGLQALAEPTVNLAYLAVELGFSSQSHFTDAFRAEFGVSPGRLRRLLRGGLARD